jgi:hypothetical protein
MARAISSLSSADSAPDASAALDRALKPYIVSGISLRRVPSALATSLVIVVKDLLMTIPLFNKLAIANLP